MIFTEFGWPFILRSDNGPFYSSKEFQQFLELYQVHHTTSSPHHPQSNGFAEALVGISKKLMERSIKDGKLWNYRLLQYQVTPIFSTIPFPLEALTGRKPRTSLPQTPSSIEKSVESSSNVNIHPVLPPAATAWNSNQDSLFSWRKYMEKSGRQETLTNQGARFLLGKVSRWFHPEKDLPDDQTQVTTFSFWVGNPEQGVEQFSIYSLKCIQEFPSNAPRHGATSLTDKQSGYNSIAWKRDYSREAGHCIQFSKFLWCTTFHPSSKEIQPARIDYFISFS